MREPLRKCQGSVPSDIRVLNRAEKCVFSWIGGEVCFWRASRSRGQDLLRFADVVGSCLRNMAYIQSCSCCFSCFVLCSGRAPSLRGTNVVGSRAHARALSEGI